MAGVSTPLCEGSDRSRTLRHPAGLCLARVSAGIDRIAPLVSSAAAGSAEADAAWPGRDRPFAGRGQAHAEWARRTRRAARGRGYFLSGQSTVSGSHRADEGTLGHEFGCAHHMLLMGATGSGKTVTLLSLCSNALTWGSGFFYSDGKADNSLHAAVWSLCRRFGREDDYLVLNFMTGGADPYKKRKSTEKSSNGANPWFEGS